MFESFGLFLVVIAAWWRSAPDCPSGPLDVLVGYDGSPESAGALEAVVALLGDQIGRLTVATVVPFGDVRGKEQEATRRLRRLTGRVPGLASDLEVLHGHPSGALQQYAADGGYDLTVVGHRGAGIAKTIFGSAATELARDSRAPVLIVGGQPGAVDDRSSRASFGG